MKVGIVGISGFGGSELLRLVLGHPRFELAYAAGESTAGRTLGQLFPAVRANRVGELAVQPFAPADLPELDVLFASLPTGKSAEALARVSPNIRIVDLGGDHRFKDGWTYGLTELPGLREAIRKASRLANPGCYPAAAITALAPLLKARLVESDGIVIDAKSGVTGTGRGGASGFGYVETSEDLFAYGLESHPHVPEIEEALGRLAGRRSTVAFTPHLVPMKRGLLATCYAKPTRTLTAQELFDAASEHYKDEHFVHVVAVEKGRGPHTRWANASNHAFVSYSVNQNTGLVVATGAIDNLGKGAAGQALQNANLMTGQPETAGLTGAPLLS